MGSSGPLPSIVRKREISILKNSLSSYYLNLYVYLSLQRHGQWTWTSKRLHVMANSFLQSSFAEMQLCLLSWALDGELGELDSGIHRKRAFLQAPLNIPFQYSPPPGTRCLMLDSLQDKKACLLSVKRIKLLLNKEDPFGTNSSQ